MEQLAPQGGPDDGQGFEDFMKSMGLDGNLGAAEQDLLKKMSEDARDVLGRAAMLGKAPRGGLQVDPGGRPAAAASPRRGSWLGVSREADQTDLYGMSMMGVARVRPEDRSAGAWQTKDAQGADLEDVPCFRLPTFAAEEMFEVTARSAGQRRSLEHRSRREPSHRVETSSVGPAAKIGARRTEHAPTYSARCGFCLFGVDGYE